MNTISTLKIPTNFNEMKKTYEMYYGDFYFEMVHISNSNLSAEVEKYLKIIVDLSKSPSIEDTVRASIGITSLHEFGFDDFPRLTRIFDRLIPQNQYEYVKFTSWCAGKLVHHPTFEQSRYVAHLLERITGWIRAHGRRSRHLAAVCMIENLSFNAGSDVVVFFEQLQSAIWILVSHPSMQLIRATASAVNMFTRAVLRYRRNDLDAYLDFFTKLCVRLLSFGSPIKIFAALKLLQQIIRSCPDYFQSKFCDYYDAIIDTTYGGPVLVQSEAFVSIASMSIIDPKQFIEICVEPLLEQTDDVLLEFPSCISGALVTIIQNASEYVETRLDDFKEYARKLITESDPCFKLLTALLKKFGEKALPIDDEMINTLLESPITEEFNNFFTALAVESGENIPQYLPEKLCKIIIDNFESTSSILALELLGNLPKTAIVNEQKMMKMITEKAMFGTDQIRKVIPLAVYNLATSTGNQSYIRETSEKLFQLAMFDPSTDVRYSILNVLKTNITKESASPESLKFLQLFASDDSTTVRSLVFKTIGMLEDINPLYVSNITRHSLLEHLYIIKNVPGIRLRARIIKTLPDLIQASETTMKIYAKPFMEMAMDILTHPVDKTQLNNFLEIESSINIIIDLFDSIALVAKIAPDVVADESTVLIPLICQKLVPNEERALILSSLHLLFILFSPPASTLRYRVMAPLVLSECSQLLRNTQSRKIRMAILRVIGAIGVLEVHQRLPPKGSEAPKNVDEGLSRQFFNPSRDTENAIDDTLLLKPNTCEQSYITIVSNSLLKILNDETLSEFYGDTVQALCYVLKTPKMFMLSFYDMFFSRLLEILENSNDFEAQQFLPYLANVINNSSHNSTPFVERTMKFITERFSNTLAIPLLDIILSFVTVLRDGFAPYASSAISLMVSALEANKSSNYHICERILDISAAIGIYATDLLYLLIPQVCDVSINESALVQVRIKALNSIEKIAAETDLYLYLGPIVRALNYNLSTRTSETHEAAFALIKTLLRTHGNTFLHNAMPLIDYIRRINHITPDLEKNIEAARTNEFFTPDISAKPIQRKKKAQEHAFSEDSLVARATTPALGYGRHLEQWLHSFIITCISSSPNDQIRSCTTLAANYYPLATWLFKIAFFSCWQKISPAGRASITSSFHGLIVATENYESVATEIMDLIFFMNKFDCKMDIPIKDLAKAALRYGYNAFALCLQESGFQNGQVNADSVLLLIDIYIKLGNWDNAIAVWEMYSQKVPASSRQDILVKLHMWDKVLPTFKTKFTRQKSPDAFSGLVRSYSHLAQWPDVMNEFGNFKKLNRTQKRDLASYFGNAAYQLEDWNSLDEILKYRPDDSLRCMTLEALNRIYNKNYDIDQLVTNAWSVFASRPTSFWEDNQTIQRDVMLQAQQIVEVLELREWAMHPNLREEIEKVWKQRLQTAPRDFETWFRLILNHEKITHTRNECLIDFFQLKSQTLGTKINDKVFNAIFPSLNFSTSPELDKVCFAVNNWNLGRKDEALSQMKILSETVKGELLPDCHVFYAKWLLEKSDDLNSLLKAYSHVKKVPIIDSLLKRKDNDDDSQFLSYDSSSRNLHRFSPISSGLYLPSRIVRTLEPDFKDSEVLRQWSDINTDLISKDPTHLTTYVTNAIDALSECCKISPSFTDVVQLLNLFFEHAKEGDVFEQSRSCITQLSKDLLLQASPQLLVQLSHSSDKVAAFVHDILFDLLEEHYHGLIFSLIVNTFSKNPRRAKASEKLYAEFSAAHPEEAEEVVSIRKCLLRAAVTWYEKCLQFITDAFDHYSLNNIEKMAQSLQCIVKMSKKPKCELHYQFLRQYQSKINSLEQLLRVFSPRNQSALGSITNWCKIMQNAISEDIRRIRIIQLSSLSAQLGTKSHFKLAVPGTYKPGKPIIRIQYFVGQFTVYMSKQQPKDVILRGEDGNFYQYLVKGHEDLRLDERIMQFFRLINSFLKKETSFGGNIISTISVIPLSIQHGLVSWVRGTDTLRAFVEKYRNLYDRNPTQEYKLLEEFSYTNFDYMPAIQKQQVIEKTCRIVPDTDIAEFFRLKADCPETWLKQIKTFTISTAMTSIIGYIIGLGDRHPSNLLIDKLSGKVIHIDFGDCFERAAKRSFLPEVVPFRLTRMMVKALGVAGVGGMFKTTFVNTSNVLRENKRVLIMVLSIFVHEPLVDPEELGIGSSSRSGSKRSFAHTAMSMNVNTMGNSMAGSVIERGRVVLNESASQQQSSIEMRNRVNQKLSGTDFGNDIPLTVEQQAELLIRSATNPYNLAKMYSGWCSFW